jgi:hypothetical protein
MVRDGAPCFGALGRRGFDQFFMVDAAGSRMEAKVNRTSGDPRAYNDRLGLSYVVVFHRDKHT